MNTESANGARHGFTERILPAAVLALCLAVFGIQAWTSLVQESATWDETGYFGLGKYLLLNHRWDVPGATTHPPLSYYLHSLPLLFFRTDPGLWEYVPALRETKDFPAGMDLPRGQALLSSPANHGDQMLDASRLMMVLLAVVLGCFVYAWSFELYGKWGAMLASALYCFSPNILAHARLITPDIALTAFFFMTLYYAWRLCRRDRLADAVVGGFCLGLALLSKHNAVLLLPICGVLWIVWSVKHKKIKVKHPLVFLLVGFWTVFLVYGMNINPYLDGIEFQRRHSSAGALWFLMGRFSTEGWWYYFIVVFLLKTPIPVLLLLAVAAALLVGKMRRGDWIGDFFLLLPAAVVFCFFSLEKRDLGLRYILPIYPLLFVFAGGTARFFLSRKPLAWLLAAGMTWYVASSFWIHPHYLAYFNELAGGPDNGYKYLIDSNLDWGQDLKGLKKFMVEHGISKINLSYFGSDSPDRYGIDYNWLPSDYLRDPDPHHHPKNPKGWFAISATDLQGVYLPDHQFFARFKSMKPFAKIGYSIFIYKVDE